MVRIKRGVVAHRKRKRLLKLVKGYKWKRKSKYRLAKDAFTHALVHAFRHRKEKKRERRRLWQTQISAKVREFGLNYSKFIHLLKEKKIEIDRKILAEMAKNYPKIFEKIVETAKS